MLSIKLIERNKVDLIDSQQWNELATNSQFKNPFFSQLVLSAALKNISLKKNIKVVTAFEQEKLVALFPVIIYRHYLGFKCIKIWCHEHCFISDPLVSDTQLMDDINLQLLNALNASCFLVETYSPMSLGKLFNQRGFHRQSFRGMITQFKDKQNYYQSLSKKVRSESRRVIKKIFSDTSVYYTTSEKQLDYPWFQAYCQLEHAGWKSKVKGAILSQPEYQKYYEDFIEQAIKDKSIQFQALMRNDKPIAIAIRMLSEDYFFEIKTSFDDNFRQLYPGVVLELLNLEGLEGVNFTCVDSCTDSHNRVINRLWPEQKIIFSSIFFKNNLIEKIFYRILSRQNKLLFSFLFASLSNY
ncbi:GNAT family N-acetyltransferase [Aliikangiella maris]|uniref:GNAT family N-acetyltransferase n=2 Tax=Aliikangiella maris TaxID=3162458 RepID=A0ABV2BSH4_9GAMM